MASSCPPCRPAKQQQDTGGHVDGAGTHRRAAGEAAPGLQPGRDDDSPIERTFDTLLAYCASTGVVAPLGWPACISFNEVYALVRGTGPIPGRTGR